LEEILEKARINFFQAPLQVVCKVNIVKFTLIYGNTKHAQDVLAVQSVWCSDQARLRLNDPLSELSESPRGSQINEEGQKIES